MKSRGTIERTCPQCGKGYTMRVAVPRQFCSRDCKHAAQVRSREYPCPECGVLIRDTGRTRRTYCSRTCANAAKMRPVERTCLNCGKHYVRSPSRAASCCSAECYDRYYRAPLAERFWRRVEKTDTCWLWLGATTHFGYGLVDANVDGKRRTWQAHRFAWELDHGPIPNGMQACHRCDNPRCVRPDHLFIGTQADNMRDMRTKGREAAGSRHGMAKLTPAEVLQIRASVEPQGKIAQRFHVSQGAIQLIRAGKNWKRLI